MKTIVFAARKGGSSKTTLTAHLAVEAGKTQPVTIVDCDPQASLTRWWDDRQADTPKLMDVPLLKLARELAKVAGMPGLVMIDTPPLDTGIIINVIKLADLVIIPVKPSPNDLRGVAATVEMVSSEGKPFIFVLSQAISRTTITHQARAVLAKYGRVAPMVVHNRVDFSTSMSDGRTAGEIAPGGLAAQEITYLWKSLSKQVKTSAKQ